MPIRRIAFALTLLAAAPCFASVQWAGDFESGNLNQWTGKQTVSADRLQIVSDPVRQGRFALRVLVRHGDDPINASGNRNEVWQQGRTEEGTETYYRWSTMFAPDFPSANDWQLFAQWHQPEDCCGSPPIQFYVYGEEIRFTVSTGQTLVWRTPLQRGAWHDFVLHVRFSNDARVGFVELWYDGEHVLPKTYAATRANDYLKLGLYRSEAITADGVLYQDGMIRGDTLEDVMPPAPQPPPSPTPPPAQTPPGQTPPSTHPPSNPVGSPTVDTGGGSPGGPAASGGCSATGTAPLLAAGLLGMAAMLRASRRRRQALAISPINNRYNRQKSY
jgi:hypothetical protein